VSDLSILVLHHISIVKRIACHGEAGSNAGSDVTTLRVQSLTDRSKLSGQINTVLNT
jgi:hypothetical protein